MLEALVQVPSSGPQPCRLWGPPHFHPGLQLPQGHSKSSAMPAQLPAVPHAGTNCTDRKNTSAFFHSTLSPKQLIGIIKQYNDLIIRSRTHVVFIMTMITFQ
jgi:hypothetical protein